METSTFPTPRLATWDRLVTFPTELDPADFFPHVRTMPDGRRGITAFQAAVMLVRDADSVTA